MIMKHRFHVPAADPDIVILDIDEPALAALAPDFGRFPWPRSVMAEIVEGIQAQKPRAIVFDITFSDPDVFHADADRYFRDVIAATPGLYFPMIRLNPANDRISELRVASLSSAQRTPAAMPDATLAAVVPYFHADVPSVALGTNNLYADADGIMRSYHIFRDVSGWRVPSLPALVATKLGAQLPERPDVLMNFRGAPPAYARVSFHEVYFDLQREQRQRPADEFAGKIVVIGSTAPSLFDIKPTPVAVLHPGVEILATALDNFRNHDYVVELPPWVYITITVAALFGLAWIFSIGVEARAVNIGFTIMQSAFLGISFLALNYSRVFVDLTAPFAFCLALFSVAKVHGLLVTSRRAGHPLAAADETANDRSELILAHAAMTDNRSRNIMRRLVWDSRYGFAVWPLFRPWPLLDTSFRHAITLGWLVHPGNAARVAAEITEILRVAGERGATGSVALQVVCAPMSGNPLANADIMRALGKVLSDDAGIGTVAPGTVQIHASESYRKWLESLAPVPSS
jgi:CHASE2 domain-containing sensor protein